MSFTLYDDSIPVAQDALKSLLHILKVGEQQPNAADLPAARLCPDMLPLTFQVEITADTAVKLVARLSGTEPFRFEDKVLTFADMFARIEKAQEVLAKVDRALINSRTSEKILMAAGSDGKRVPFPSNAVVYGYSLPTIFFHVATAYGILRKEGVPLGKMDYLESFGERFSVD